MNGAEKPEQGDPNMDPKRYADGLTWCRACGGSGRESQIPRYHGACRACAGSGQTSVNEHGERVAWTRKGWIKR